MLDKSAHIRVARPSVPRWDTTKRLLAMRPKALGLAVPGRARSAPGMDVPGRKDPYDVLPISAEGQSTVFASCPR